MDNYSLQKLRQLDSSILRRSNKRSCTHFQKPWLLISLWFPNFFSVWAWYTQKLAATSKFNDNDPRTAFISHMFEYFPKTVIIKWKELIRVCIRRRTQERQYKLFKPTSLNIIGNGRNFHSERAASNQHRGLGGSLRDRICWKRGREFSSSCSSSIRMRFSGIEPIAKSIKIEKENGVSMPGRRIASMFKTGSSQWNLISSR